MTSLPSTIGIAIVAFASTNIDDMFVLVAFFADPRYRRRSVVVGQVLGMAALVCVSAAAALLALTVPAGWVALLGFVPLLLGLRQLWVLRRRGAAQDGDLEERRLRDQEHRAEHRFHSQVLTVAAVTVANGGDNLAVWIPLFAVTLGAIATYAVVFAGMTALWCALGFLLVSNRLLGGPIRRYSHLVLPVVLVALGIHILSGALVILH